MTLSTDPRSGQSPDDPAPHRALEYRILRKLGEGGMGTVFEAEQDNPRRRVALKIVRAERMTPEMRRRFERESHVLGLLQHPGIAQIYQAGTADLFGDGELLSYFAMELVSGLPLTAFAREAGLNLRQRLELLARVCDAVQHAHQKGVVHRDLKPGNILVVAQESTSMSTSSLGGVTDELAHAGQPKILDFGLARIAESDLPAITVQTEMGRLLGTVQYMSPEQVTGDSSRIDARSDVYALGVIGYELVSGRLPHDFRGMPQLEALRVIQEEEATPLSSLDRALRGDVETILAKAMEKDPARRYPSAAELAADVRRYLRDEPIVARPPSAVYQLRKFAVRNKVLVGGIAAVFVALIIGLIGTAMGYVEARHSEALARDKSEEARLRAEEATRARDEATAARDLANKAREEAHAAAAEAEAVNRFLVNDMLGASDPATAKGRTITLAEVLENARTHVDDAFEDQPLVKARLHDTLGQIEYHLGRFEQAEHYFRSAWTVRRERLGADADETLGAQINLATILRELERGPEALALQHEVVDLYRRRGDAPNLISALTRLGQTQDVMGELAAAETSYDEALRLAEARPPEMQNEGNTLATLLTDRASLHKKRELYPQARASYERALALYRAVEGDTHPDVARVRAMLASLTRTEGRPKEALAELEAVLALERKLLPGDHPDIANTLSLMSATAMDLADYARAETWVRESLAMRERLGQGVDSFAATARVKLARVLTALGRQAESVTELERAIALFESFAGRPDADLGDAYFELALAKRGVNEFAAASTAADKSLEHRRAGQTGARQLAQSISLCAQLRHSVQDYDAAERLYREALERYEQAEGQQGLNVAIAHSNIGTFALDREELDVAESSLRAAVEIASTALDGDHPTLALMRYNLARVLRRVPKNDEAIELLRAALDAQRVKLPAQHTSTLGTLVELGDALLDAARATEAEPFLRESYAARTTSPALKGARFARAAGSLGACMLALQRYDEAEPLLLESYKAWTTPKDAARVARALADLYTALDDGAEAERWRAAAQ
ncbi:MAG: tetratricopeptide repeat protein [Planctomycetota bacterium]